MNPDLFIACGGLSGLATAILAAGGGLSIAVSDTAPPPIDKACGISLSPDALEALPYLGVDFYFIRSFLHHGIRFLGTGANPKPRFPMTLVSASGAPFFTLFFSVMPKRSLAVSSGIQPSVTSRKPPLLQLSMIETRNHLDMFQEKGITNAPPGPRLPI